MTNTPPAAVQVIPDGTPLVQAEFQNIGHYAKIIVALLGPALAIIATASVFSPIVAAQAAVAILGAIPVYFVTKKFALKAVVAGAIVLTQAVFAFFGPDWGWGHPSWHDWISVAIAVLTAAGVYAVPNTAKSTIKLVPATAPVPVADGISIGAGTVPIATDSVPMYDTPTRLT